MNEWLNDCFIPINFLTLLPHRISIWFFIKGKKLKGRKTTAPGQEFVAEKPQPGRKRDSAGGTPFHALARRARLSWGAPLARARSPLASGPPGARAGPLRTCLPQPRTGPEAGKPAREALPLLGAPPSDRPPAPRYRAPRQPGPGAGERPGRARRRPGRRSPLPRRACSPPALTVRARRPGHAEGQAEQRQERQQAPRREAGAPGPPGHAAAAASLPARPRLLLRPQGAEIRRRAPRGGGRAGRFRRQARELRAPRGPGERQRRRRRRAGPSSPPGPRAGGKARSAARGFTWPCPLLRAGHAGGPGTRCGSGLVTQLNVESRTVPEENVPRALSVWNDRGIQGGRELREAPPGWQRKRGEGQKERESSRS